MAAQKDIGKLVVQLQMDLEGMKSSLDKSNKLITKATNGWKNQFQSAANSIGAIFTGAFLAGAVQQGIASVTQGLQDMLEKFDDLADTADKLNTTTTSLQEMGYAASQTGTDLDTVTSAVAKMQVNLGKGGKAVSEALDKLKLSVSDLRKMDTGEQLAAIGTGLKNIPGDFERAAVAAALLGKQAKELQPLLVQFAELRKEAHALGVVVDEDTVRAVAAFADKMEVVKLQGTALLASVMKPLIPALTEVAEKFLGAGKAAGDMGSGFRGAKSDAEVLGNMLAQLVRFTSAAITTQQSLQKIMQGSVVAIGNFRLGTTIIQTEAGKIADAFDSMSGPSEQEQKLRDRAAALRQQEEMYRRQAKLWTAIAEARRDGTKAEDDDTKKKKDAKAAADALAKSEKKLFDQRSDALRLLQDAIDAEDKLRADRERAAQDLIDSERILAGVTEDQIRLDRAKDDGYSKDAERDRQRADANMKRADALDRAADAAKRALDDQLGGAISLAQAYKDLDEAFASGRVNAAEYAAGLKELDAISNQLTETQQQYLDVIEGGLNDVFQSVIDGSGDAEDAVKRLIAELARLALIKAATAAATGQWGWGGVAKGATFDAGGVIHKFAQGAVFTTPTQFSFAGKRGEMAEAGPEAVMPLGRVGGRLGVHATAPNVQVFNYAGASVSVDTEGETLRIMIDKTRQALAGDIRRGGNELAGAFERTYGVRR